MQIHIIS
jgi:hypothetical protein